MYRTLTIIENYREIISWENYFNFLHIHAPHYGVLSAVCIVISHDSRRTDDGALYIDESVSDIDAGVSNWLTGYDDRDTVPFLSACVLW